MQKTTSLVTGGAGFIGSHVVHHLIKMNHKVVVLDDLSGGFMENIHADAEFCKGSITDEFLVNGLFEEYRFDYVFHLAAYAAEGLSHFIRKFNYQNNLIGSINLINAAVNFKVKRFVFTSSIAVYGTNNLPFKEDQKPNPEDPYGIAKYAVEMDLKAAHDLFGLDYTIFRPHNVYGPHQNIGDRYRNVVGIFMNQLLKGEDLTIFGDGEQSRAFSYIEDVAPYIALSAEMETAKNEIINIGGEVAYTVNQLATEVKRVMKRSADLVHLPARLEVEHAYSCQLKMKRIFNPKPPTELIDGLTAMAKWVEATGARKSKDFERIEIKENLPESWRTNP